MAFLITAYLAAWVAVAAYLGWLAAKNRTLAQRMDELEAVLRQFEDGDAERLAA